MKYIKNNFIINLNFEILSIIQSVALKDAMWINYSQVLYINMLKSELDFNCKEVKGLIDYFDKNNLAFHLLPQIVATMDNNYNIDIDYLKEQGLDVKNLEEFEKLVKELNLGIDINKIYIKYKDFYMSKLNEIIEFLKNVKLDIIYDFYGYKIGEINLVISFLSGNFGIKYKNDLYCYKSFKLDVNNNVILKKSIIPFLFHEFSHSYIHEIVSKYIDKLVFLDDHYNSIYVNNTNFFPYQNKKGLFEEILVRANEMYLSKKYMSEDSMNIYIKKQLNMNIYYFKELVNLIENKFKNYINYEQFFVQEIIPFYKLKFIK